MLTQERVKELFEYWDGGLYWKENRYANKVKGKRFGSINSSGYRQGSVLNSMQLEHRMIYLYHKGTVPERLDHIDGNELNNNIENLRPATAAENARNRKKVRGSSGHTGVSWSKPHSKWKVHLQCNKQKMFFGLYDDLELACLVADEARDKYHGDFSSTRRSSNV